MRSLMDSPPGMDYGILFEPDELTAAQFYDTTRRTYHANPELRLMGAILEDAVATLTTDQRHCPIQRRRDFEAAIDWITDSGDEDWVFSFANICDTLGINAAYLRQGLLQRLALDHSPAGTRSRQGPSFRHAGKRRFVRLRAG